ncbi:hypothetical protein G3A_12615 [Bacillus sp. 17376]|uniref:HTH cro/C1-type domain-containing protein n=1 Tax=Mesobacillus boroniphilus JCM 21738 TaxID=1294265 RepID=W4RJL7_9BACI|nr:hypothetical protein G3A_12615 [Bacillus sp. 17376]GAE43779.1 hypothetical protein JCM21738_438 [Mesobacillus boroniphilus JCM 21738]
MTVGEKIKSLRLEKKYSISELSEKENVSKSYLSYTKEGSREIHRFKFFLVWQTT